MQCIMYGPVTPTPFLAESSIEQILFIEHSLSNVNRSEALRSIDFALRNNMNRVFSSLVLQFLFLPKMEFLSGQRKFFFLVQSAYSYHDHFVYHLVEEFKNCGWTMFQTSQSFGKLIFRLIFLSKVKSSESFRLWYIN